MFPLGASVSLINLKLGGSDLALYLLSECCTWLPIVSFGLPQWHRMMGQIQRTNLIKYNCIKHISNTFVHNKGTPHKLKSFTTGRDAKLGRVRPKLRADILPQSVPGPVSMNSQETRKFYWKYAFIKNPQHSVLECQIKTHTICWCHDVLLSSNSLLEHLPDHIYLRVEVGWYWNPHHCSQNNCDEQYYQENVYLSLEKIADSSNYNNHNIVFVLPLLCHHLVVTVGVELGQTPVADTW